jgi:hypothetical protein
MELVQITRTMTREGEVKEENEVAEGRTKKRWIRKKFNKKIIKYRKRRRMIRELHVRG